MESEGALADDPSWLERSCLDGTFWDRKTMNDIKETLDWEGKPVSCSACEHRDLLAEGRCQLRRACVHDRYARRIDRFFYWNRELANRYLTHPYFEVRAIAAKFSDVFHLPPLLEDADETVRFSALIRLPRKYLLKMRNDPDREVRIRVAYKLEGRDLLEMRTDQDYYVRLVVARRLPPAMLP
ncbi:MAG: 4Fe4S-binding leucine-rich repeat protein [Sulfuricella sp.]